MKEREKINPPAATISYMKLCRNNQDQGLDLIITYPMYIFD